MIRCGVLLTYTVMYLKSLTMNVSFIAGSVSQRECTPEYEW